MALQTYDIQVSGRSASGGITYTFIVRIIENSVDKEKNCTNVTVKALLQSDYPNSSFIGQYISVSVKIDDNTVISALPWTSCEGTGEHEYGQWTGDLQHTQDGSLTVKVSGALYPYNAQYAFMPPYLRFTEQACTLSTIIQNTPPAAPEAVQAAVLVAQGETLAISWQVAADAEDNITGYELERSDNGGEDYIQVYSGTELSCSDTASAEAGTVMQYRVRAKDAEGAFSEWSQVYCVTVNTPPACTPGFVLQAYTAADGPVLTNFTDGQPLYLGVGQWTDPDNELQLLRVQQRQLLTGGIASEWQTVADLAPGTESVRTIPLVAADGGYIQYRICALDQLNAASEWVVSDWIRRQDKAFSSVGTLWYRPTIGRKSVMPYIRIGGSWIRYGGLYPDPASAMLGVGVIGTMILEDNL